jgi:hypothetical protein
MSAANMPILNARLPHELDKRWKATLEARGLTVTEAAREAVALWIDGGAGRAEAATPSRPEINPLRALRESAGLSQRDAAERVGVARRTWQIAEAAATATPAMVERARKALTVKR